MAAMDTNTSPLHEMTPSKTTSLTGVLIGDDLGQIKRIDLCAKTKVINIKTEPIDGIHPSRSVSSICCLNNSSVDHLIANKCNTLSLYNSVSNHLEPIRVGVANESFLMGAQPVDDNNIAICYENGSIYVKNIETDLIKMIDIKRKAVKLLGLDLIDNTSDSQNNTKHKVSKSVQCSNGKDVLAPKSSHKSHPKPSKFVNSDSSMTTSCTSIFSPNYNTSTSCVTCFKVCDQMLAIAGKNVDLKVFDLNTKQPIFTAKSLSHDWLGLKPQTWISGVEWVGGNSKSNTCPSWVATCSRSDSIVRIYDIKCKQRKPVMNINLKDQTFNNDSNPPSFTAIRSTCLPHTIAKPSQNLILGTTIGRMMALDLRFSSQNYRYLGVFKGFGGGAIRDIQYVPQNYYSFKILSCSLDRFIRIHNFKTSSSSSRAMETKIYLKTRPTCVYPICSSNPKHETYVMDTDDDDENSDNE